MLKNADISEVKAKTAVGDRPQIESDIRRLRATIARYEEKVAALVADLLEQRQRKVTLDADKTTKRSQLDALRNARLPGFERSVNKYLKSFGADFKIISVTSDNQGGTPCVKYALQVNETRISIDTFKNTLSGGDRSTLALSFFFSSLEDCPNLEELVVVLDDPFTSMDRHRTANTVQSLRLLRTQVKQLVVLSHDGVFLWKIQELLSAADRETGLATLKIARDNGWTSSKFLAWDIAQQERTLFDKWHEKLRRFRDGEGEPSDIAPLLRFVMEAFCRVAFPEAYPSGKLLGQFWTDENRRREDTRNLLNDDDFRQLGNIKDYANKFHHATNTNYEAELANISENELKGYVDQVLEFTSYRLSDSG